MGAYSVPAALCLLIVCCFHDQLRVNGQSSSTPLLIGSLLDVGQGASAPVLSVRLVGGNSPRDGRVEVLYNGTWGTICGDGWTTSDAQIVCFMLGYVGPAIAAPGGAYPPGNASEPIWLRAVVCTGLETNLGACRYQGWNNTGCVHAEDAGVVCLGDFYSTMPSTTPRTTGTTLPPTICNNPSTDIRLVGANGMVTNGYGRVQVLYNGSFRAVCSDRWGAGDAQVVCRMLCYNPANARAVLGMSVYGNATEGYWLSGLLCSGSEANISSCPHNPYGVDVTACSPTEPAAVSCVLDAPTPQPLPAPTILCSGEMLTAIFTLTSDPLLAPQYLSVAASSGDTLAGCNASTSNDSTTVRIAIPFVGGGCNTTKTMNDTYIMYTNVVRYAVPSPSDVITRTTIYYITVTCLINRTQDPNNAFDPATRTPPPQSGGGAYEVLLLLFSDSNFQTVLIENPLKVTLGDWVYAGVQLYSSDPNLKLVLVDLYVTPTPDPSVVPLYYLMQNKCTVDSTVTLYPINDTLFALRFQSFQFLTNYTYMYLHAFVYVCATSESTGQCDRNCAAPPQGRRRRSLDQPPSPPGYMVNGRVGISLVKPSADLAPPANLAPPAAASTLPWAPFQTLTSSLQPMTSRAVTSWTSQGRDDTNNREVPPSSVNDGSDAGNRGHRFSPLHGLFVNWTVLISLLLSTRWRTLLQ